jgi:hypothetical protein
LGFIVGGPILLVRYRLAELDTFRFDYRSIGHDLALDGELDREQMLALEACFLMVRASACLSLDVDAVNPLRTGLRRD